jgi:hypothetical protein
LGLSYVHNGAVRLCSRTIPVTARAVMLNEWNGRPTTKISRERTI